LVTTSAIAVLLGEGIARAVPELWIKRPAGLAFVVLGTRFLLERG
jgi:putative Ca2+/H+ antiporter (TMEM165/GDT1 family)